jgi:hypothetical protein
MLHILRVHPRATGRVVLHVVLAVGAVVAATGCAPLYVPGASRSRCAPVPAGIVGWWPGDGSAVDIVGKNDGSPEGPVAYAPGMVGQAFQFDGTDDIVTTTDGLPVIAQDRTIELWVYITSFAGFGPEEPLNSLTFAVYGTEGLAGEAILFGASLYSPNVPDASDAGLFIGASDWGNTVEGTALSPGRWYHVALAIRAQSFQLYVDGREVASQGVPLETAEDTLFYIAGPGAAPPPPQVVNVDITDGGYEHFAGLADEVSIYNRALSSDEIVSIYAAGARGKCRD